MIQTDDRAPVACSGLAVTLLDDFVDGASFLCFNLEFKAVDPRRIGCDCAKDHNQDIEPKWIRPQSSSSEFRQTTGSVIGVSVSRLTLGSPLDSEPAEIFPFHNGG